ncbi:MAG: hypothetical protein CMF62_03840 [Magnetococcales bacterium]|nr:hypothetical protein [Magnetococcales bacterium]
MKFDDQVIICRTNRQLDSFELELIKNRVSYVKSRGVGILDRSHIKDFLAFLIILVNVKSVIHWKRILVNINGIGQVKINEIVSQKNILKFIIKHNQYKKYLSELQIALQKIFKLLKDKNQNLDKICSIIIDYLKPILKKNQKLKESTSYEEKINDIETLKIYLSRYSSLETFLEDIHLNFNINKEKSYDSDDFLFLTTIHGSKGLEWEYVYLSGASSSMMPQYRSDIYLQEIKDVEEERRLFYVGCSRAKKNLEITCSYDTDGTYVSPFIKELNSKYYDGFNLRFASKLKKGNITNIVNNFIISRSLSPVYNYLKELDYESKNYFIPTINPMFKKFNCDKLYGIFIDNLIMKMIYYNFKNDIDKLTVPVYSRFNLKKDKHYYNYCDKNSDWRDTIESTLHISCKKSYIPVKKQLLYEWIKKETYYEKLEKSIISLVKESIDQCSDINKPRNMINLHYNVSYGEILGETDLVVGRTLIEIKTSTDNILSSRYVLQTLMYRYALRKKNIRIDRIILFNPLLGESYILQITPNWKHTYRVYKEIIKT